MPINKKALLIGLDQYPDARNNLNSCVADTLAFKSMLINNYEFDPADIVLLHNTDATLDGVRTGMENLFRGAMSGDNLVYFESSHGYRYPKGNTMVEVLCLYDAFLEDSEFTARTQVLPPDVLTVVLDACHSGGLDKLFFPPSGVTVAKAKVWQPSSEESAANSGLLQQVSRFKFFGRAPTMDTGAVAKQFMLASQLNIPLQKDLEEGEVELNGALFAACKADETAAAGSQPTDGLSAFTYGITTKLDTTISLRSLGDRVVARLVELQMRQTPVVEVPVLHPELGSNTFISMQPTGQASTQTSTGTDTGTDYGDAIAIALQQLQTTH